MALVVVFVELDHSSAACGPPYTESAWRASVGLLQSIDLSVDIFGAFRKQKACNFIERYRRRSVVVGFSKPHSVCRMRTDMRAYVVAQNTGNLGREDESIAISMDRR